MVMVVYSLGAFSCSFLKCMNQIIDINTDLARGKIIMLKTVMTKIDKVISSAVLFKPCSNIQKTNGIAKCPEISIVAQAGPSSARNGV